jgi:hypothetical protein
MNEPIGQFLIADVRREFANQRKLAERAIAQLSARDLFETLDDDANSVAVLMKHVGGNLRSRWTDFLTTDGEKPDRNRDGEFVSESDSADSVKAVWNEGWRILDVTLETLRPESLTAEVRIRGEAVPVIQALNRSLAHTAQHVGQIILLARHLRGAEWQTLSIPRGKSADFLPKPPSEPART